MCTQCLNLAQSVNEPEKIGVNIPVALPQYACPEFLGVSRFLLPITDIVVEAGIKRST